MNRQAPQQCTMTLTCFPHRSSHFFVCNTSLADLRGKGHSRLLSWNDMIRRYFCDWCREASIRAPNDHHVSSRAYPHIGMRSHALLCSVGVFLKSSLSEHGITATKRLVEQLWRFVQSLPCQYHQRTHSPPSSATDFVCAAQNHAAE